MYDKIGRVSNLTLYGAGDTAVIFTTMSDAKQETWAEMAQAVAEKGYLALTFNFRFWGDGSRIDPDLRDRAATDLVAPIDFVEGQGAQRVVLAGASLGGMTSARVAASQNPAAVIILAAPLDWPTWPSLRVTQDDIKKIHSPIPAAPTAPIFSRRPMRRKSGRRSFNSSRSMCPLRIIKPALHVFVRRKFVLPVLPPTAQPQTIPPARTSPGIR